MITEEKIKTIRRSLKRGVPSGELHNDMIKEGYSEEDLKKIFAPKEYDMRSWYLISAFILFIAGVGMVFKNGSLLLLIFSAIMFITYYFEKQKIERRRSK